MSRTIEFGETVEGYDIPVLNEREIRASAGLLFLIFFASWMQILFDRNFIPLKLGILMFFLDFSIRVFIDPKYSPSLILGRFIVRKQKPEYVGSAPKKFAWIIGFSLSAIMFLHLVVGNSHSAITGIICLTCLTFLFFESAFGICLGCLFYGFFHKEKPRHCPGDSCEPKVKHDIKKISLAQIFVLIGFIVAIVIVSIAFKEYIGLQPRDLWSLIEYSLE